MGYPSPLRTSIRKLSPNVVTVSCPFSIKNKADVGNRMTLIKYDGDIVVFSPIPYGEYMNEALEALGGPNLKPKYLVIVNFQHNLAAPSFKKEYPDIKIIAGENVELGPECPVSLRLTSDMGNRLLKAEDLRQKWGVDEEWWCNLELCYLTSHKNKDVVMYEKTSRILIEGDVVFNMGVPDENDSFEQYSTATGYPEKHFPYTGWSYMLRFVNAHSFLGPWLFSRLSNTKTEGGRNAIKMLYENWDFETIVPCHGNVISKDAKIVFKKGFNL